MARLLALVSQPVIARPLTLLWEDQLVDDDVVCVNLVRRQFLDESLRLVQRQELGNADADESGLVLHVENISQPFIMPNLLSIQTYRVLELGVDLSDDCSHRVEFCKHIFLGSSPQHRAHLLNHRTKLSSERTELAQGLLQNRRERQES